MYVIKYNIQRHLLTYGKKLPQLRWKLGDQSVLITIDCSDNFTDSSDSRYFITSRIAIEWDKWVKIM